MDKIEMKNWVKRMIERHAQVVIEINKANEFLNNALNDKSYKKILLIEDL